MPLVLLHVEGNRGLYASRQIEYHGQPVIRVTVFSAQMIGRIRRGNVMAHFAAEPIGNFCTNRIRLVVF